MAEGRQWHCAIGGRKYGPVMEAELRTWVAQRRLTYRDMVWTEGMGQWQPLQAVLHMFPDGLPIPGASLPAATRQTAYPPHNGTTVLVLGILSLCLGPIVGVILGPIAWSMGNKELRRIDAGQVDPTGRGQVNGGRICGIIGFFVGLAGVVIIFIFLIIPFLLVGVLGAAAAGAAAGGM